MKDKEAQLIYEAFLAEQEDRSIPGGYPGDEVMDDEHNPPDRPGPLSSDVYGAMDKQEGISYLMSKYEGMGESQLRAHLYALNELLEMSEEERVRATGEDG
jgi:hypothetical protein